MGGRGMVRRVTAGGARGGMATLAVLADMLAVSGCSKKSERLLFNGAYYPTKARTADKAERTAFTVSVRRADQGLKGAREAGRHGGREYCLNNFGTSEIAWTVGPDAPDTVLVAMGGSLVLSGKCVLW